MKKRIFALMTAVVLVLALGSTLAFSVENRIIDEAGIFTQEEIAQLESLAEKYSAACGLELMIVTKESTGSMSADWYAGEEFRKAGVTDGALMLLDMEDRYAWLSGTGRGAQLLPDETMELLLDLIYGKLKRDDFAGAAEAFLKEAQVEARRASGELMFPRMSLVAWLVCLGIPLIAAGGFCIWVVRDYQFRDVQYEYPCRQLGRVELSRSQDIFLGKTVTSRTIQRSSSSRSGGSRSSGGRSGAGRHF